MEKTSKWDLAEILDTKEDIIACLEVALARSAGMAQLAREAERDA